MQFFQIFSICDWLKQIQDPWIWTADYVCVHKHIWKALSLWYSQLRSKFIKKSVLVLGNLLSIKFILTEWWGRGGVPPNSLALFDYVTYALSTLSYICQSTTVILAIGCQTNTPHGAFLHSCLQCSYPALMSVMLKFQSLCSQVVFPCPAAQMSSKWVISALLHCLFQSSSLCVPSFIHFQLQWIYTQLKEEGNILTGKLIVQPWELCFNYLQSPAVAFPSLFSPFLSTGFFHWTSSSV